MREENPVPEEIQRVRESAVRGAERGTNKNDQSRVRKR